MSTTTIYRLGLHPGEIGEVRNSWRGAMYVWDDIAKRYFGLTNFPMFDEAMRKKIWNASSHVKMPRHEVIVLMTTMDGATIQISDVTAVVESFDRYAYEHPNSSFGEQAAIMRAAEMEAGDLIAWNQTSVSEFWGCDWDAEKDEQTWYDPMIGDKHFDAYAEAMAEP